MENQLRINRKSIENDDVSDAANDNNSDDSPDNDNSDFLVVGG